MTDPYTIQVNNMKRAKILDNRKYTTENNENTYDIICEFCKTTVSYDNMRKHGKTSKKHKIALTIWMNKNSIDYNHENVLQIDSE